jgi:uncharacterized membrane protein YbhN (UPF0104 family)
VHHIKPEAAETAGLLRPDRIAALRRGARHIPAVLGVCLLIGAIYVVQREFRHLNLRDVGRAMRQVHEHSLIVAAIWNLLAYGVLTFYDRLATIYAGHRVSYARTALASFCAYALAHNLGFAAVSGAAVRYRLYSHWGLTPEQIAKIIAFCSLTFGLGGMSLGGVILFYEPHAVPWFGEHFPLWLLTAIGGLMWTIVGGYVFLSTRYPILHIRGRTIEIPGWRMALAQVALATVDVAVTASIFYALLPHARGLTWLRFLAVYLGSYAAGLVANVPGGLGVFDAAILLGLSRYLPAPVVLSTTFIFRLYYYVIPLFLAGFLFAGNEVLLRSRGLAHPARPAGRSPISPSPPRPASSPCAAPCCSPSAFWTPTRIIPGWRPALPISPPPPANTSPACSAPRSWCWPSACPCASPWPGAPPSFCCSWGPPSPPCRASQAGSPSPSSWRHSPWRRSGTRITAMPG